MVDDKLQADPPWLEAMIVITLSVAALTSGMMTLIASSPNMIIENTLRALDPDLDLLGTLSARAADIMAIVDASRPAARPLAMRLARTARQLPQIATDLLRQAQLSDGRPAFSVHHHGLAPTHEALARTGNRLALALVTLGLYVSGSLLALHSTGPLLAGHLPWLSVIAFAGAALLSLRLVVAIGRSGHL